MRNKALAVVLPAALAATISIAPAATRHKPETTIASRAGHGRVLTLSTGTRSGSCEADGTRVACHDGLALAVADAETGCEKVEGGARCVLETPEGPGLVEDGAGEEDPGVSVTPASSTIEVECETGAKKGAIYRLEDGDGTGACGPNREVGGKVNGGTCSKGGSECATVDCDHGCGGVSQNCSCRIRTAVPRVAPTQ